MSIKSVAIIGRGAIGLLYGTMIADTLGCDNVSFVMDDERFDRHVSEAVYVNGRECDVPTIAASNAKPVDLVLLTIKTTGLESALKTMKAVVGPDTYIASLCNGITSEEKIAEQFGWQHTVLSVAQGMDAVFIDNKLTYSHPGEIRFGASADTDSGVVEAISELYTRAGIKHTVESDIKHRLWTKLMLNVGINQTCMVYGCNYGVACSPLTEENRSFISAMREVRAVAEKEGIILTEEDLTQMAEITATLDPEGMPSMAQDRVNRKRTEVEEFAGTICRLGKKHNVLVPQNEWLYKRVKEIESSW